MSDLTEQQKVDRAAKAQALIDSELLREAFAAVERGIFDAIKASKPEEAPGRERLYLAIGVADSVQSVLRGWLGTGQIAANNIAKLKKREG